MLTLPQSLIDSIHTHCRAVYPHECCGALVGVTGDGGNFVQQAISLENAEPNSPERRFMIDPSALAKLERQAKGEGMAVVGFYHSHPDSSARASSTDREWAWPVYSYVIVSVVGGEIADTRSYCLESFDDDAPFVEESIASA